MCESGWKLYAQGPSLVDPEWGTPLDVPEEDWSESEFGDLGFMDEEEEELDGDPDFYAGPSCSI